MLLRRLHGIVLRKLPGPFFGWLSTLMFLLLMQFLIRWLPELAGKGLPTRVIVELVVYNLAYMLVLAVPMSALLAALMAFGSLAESQTYAVVKSAGISFGQLVWPALVVGMLLAGGMMYFNNVLLPEANHQAYMLWRDIRTKRPGFELRPGAFYSGIDDYTMLVRERPEGTNRLRGVTIYDYTEGRRNQVVIKAARGTMNITDGGARLTIRLYDGQVHRKQSEVGSDDRYERLTFQQHVLHLDLSELMFTREDDDVNRTDRTMPTPMMLHTIDSLGTRMQRRIDALRTTLQHAVRPDTGQTDTLDVRGVRVDTSLVTGWPVLNGHPLAAQRTIVSKATRAARQVQEAVQRRNRRLSWTRDRIKRYWVEVYKKFSIALACLVFIFIGAPLGLALGRSGLGVIGGVALGIFMFYWVTLVQGEKLADRGILPPWLGMWIANTLAIIAGAWLTVYTVKDLGATPPLRTRLWKALKKCFS
ncbi:LptF/LptG family permease [Salisaeta longa]|uniref:LptF/LptG family permease n=1 Tax=Salisaeta longa TaxID=503170 RepID=UPI0003B674DA|nr:LptF/LptG family permease [Salisaeta longa]